MSGPILIAPPTAQGLPLLPMTAAHRRHRMIHCAAVVSRASEAPATGGTFMTNAGQVAAGGGGGYYRQSTVNEQQWIEYEVGLLDTTRPWTVTVSFRRGPDRAITTGTISGATIGTHDGYTSNITYNTATWTWTPTPEDFWKVHSIRLTATSKNASSTGYVIAPTLITLSRSAGADTITPSAAP